MEEKLIGAAKSGDLQTVKDLLQRGADIHAEDDEALRWAAWKGRLAVVEFLLQRGADIHAKGDGALQWAAENGHLAVVEFLLQKGADYSNKKVRSYLRKILSVKRLPSSREELIRMMKIIMVHRE